MEIVLVNTYKFQPYIIDNIKNLKKFGNNNITIIIDKELEQYFKDYNLNIVFSEEFSIEYNQKSLLEKGFWQSCSSRFFYIYEYMKKYNRKKCFHIENDVLVYKNLKDIKHPSFDIWLVMDAPNRCIPSIIFIPNYRFIEILIKKYDYSKNDMENLSIFFNNNREICKSYPIMNNRFGILSENYKDFEYIFDGAAIGQYLGGIDPIHKSGDTSGFINETCLVDYSKYKILWRDSKPFIIIDDKEIEIINLHIHCKNLKRFIK